MWPLTPPGARREIFHNPGIYNLLYLCKFEFNMWSTSRLGMGSRFQVASSNPVWESYAPSVQSGPAGDWTDVTAASGQNRDKPLYHFRLAALTELSAALAGASEPAQLFELALRGAGRLCGARQGWLLWGLGDGAATHLWKLLDDRADPEPPLTGPAETLRTALKPSATARLAGWQLRHHSLGDFLPDLCDAAVADEWILARLVDDQGGPNGVLLLSADARSFTQEDQLLLEQYALAVSMAVQRLCAPQPQAPRNTRKQLEDLLEEKNRVLRRTVDALQGEVYDRLEAQKALSETAYSYHQLFDATPIGIALVTGEGIIIDVNRAMEQLLLAHAGEIRRTHAREWFIHRDGFRRLSDAIGRRLVLRNLDVQLRRKNGSVFDALLNIDNIRSNGQDLVLVVVKDVTERRRAERALRAALSTRRKLESIVNRSPAVAFLWRKDPSWPVEFVTHNVKQFGYTAQEFLDGRVAWPQVLYPEDIARIESELAQFAQDGRDEFIRQYRLLDKSGQVRWIEDRTIALRNSDGQITHYQGVVLDVTQRKLLEAQVLLAAQNERRRLGRDLHDTLGQNLTGLSFLIKGLAQRLRELSPQDAQQAQQLVGLINESISQARSLARGMDPVSLERGGLTAALEELAESTQRIFGVACRLYCPRPVRCPGDTAGSHLYLIAQEALNNALKHSGAAQIDIRLECDATQLVLSIEDNGRGLAPAETNRGMGMHTMRYRAGAIGASLTIGRGNGGGTVVRCTCPFLEGTYVSESLEGAEVI